MNITNYLEVIDELNEQLLENKYLENLGINFSLSTNGYIVCVDFGDFNLYNSENDCLSKYDYMLEDWVDISLKEFLINEFNDFKKELFKIDLK